MALSSKTFDYAGGAVNDLFAASAFESKATGYGLEAYNYDLAASMADKNADFTRTSTALKMTQLERQKYSVLGGQQADVASSGFQSSGSALDILRDSAQQGALQEAVAHQQGLIAEEGYRTQAQSFRNMSAASKLAQEQARKSQKNAWINTAVKAAATVASIAL